MSTLTQIAAGFIAVSTALVAQANIQIEFVESAPKDSFVINNVGACNFSDLHFEIDLSSSLGKLIFDTTATGAGVEVFQPFEVKTGEMALASANEVSDGDKSLTVSVATLNKGSSVSFTIDVDDTLPKSDLGQIRVTGSEIQGAVVRLGGNESLSDNLVGSFDNQGSATIAIPSCS